MDRGAVEAGPAPRGRSGRDGGERAHPGDPLGILPELRGFLFYGLNERLSFLGGRALALDDEGFKLNLGGHLIEDSGSGITKVFEHVGKELIHGAVSNELPRW